MLIRLSPPLVRMWTDVEQGGGFRHIPDNAMVRPACGGAVPQIAPLSLLDFRLAVWGLMNLQRNERILLNGH